MTKFITILADGMSDYPDDAGRTPMNTAKKPMMDFLAENGEMGLVQTVPNGFKPGSDVANLSVMGYAPQKYYSGRSPLEALSMGIDMAKNDVSYRMNLVTLSDDEPFDKKTMLDYSAGEISTQESTELVNFLKKELENESRFIYPGISYRHCLLKTDAELGATLTPPHDILGKTIAEYLPQGAYCNEFLELSKRSYTLLKDHPINKERVKNGKNPANCAWLWGEGRKPLLDDFFALYGIKGAVISAVDLIKGIAVAANMTSIDVEGATGNLHTNFDGKATAAIDALKNNDYVYVHIEAPDECGHQGDFNGKTHAIELIDEKIITPIFKSLSGSGEHFKILVLPDHATPICLRTHVSDPVPYALYDSKTSINKTAKTPFTESTAKESGILINDAPTLLKKLIKR